MRQNVEQEKPIVFMLDSINMVWDTKQQHIKHNAVAQYHNSPLYLLMKPCDITDPSLNVMK